MYNILSRIHRGVTENIKLIFFTETKYGYNFFVLGKSDFIYKIVINKKYHHCNCEDYLTTKKLCKHICFVLFKVLRLYKITVNNKIILRRKDVTGLKETNFFNLFYFEYLDWLLFKSYYKKMELRKNYFDIEDYKKFKSYYQQYNFMLSKNLCSSDDPCPICHMNIKKGAKCSICKKIFHTYCMAEWFKNLVIKRCPVCRSDSWNITFNFFYLLNNEKIPKHIALG